jgi:hypothetical protein
MFPRYAHLFSAALLILLAVCSCPTMADTAGIQGDIRSVDNSSGKMPLDAKQIEPAIAIRAAIFRNRQQLLALLVDSKLQSAFCSPTPNDSYELFQDSLHDELDVLWDIDIYASEYGLSRKEHEAVLSCSKMMEKYLDNFDLWQKLERDSAKK